LRRVDDGVVLRLAVHKPAPRTPSPACSLPAHRACPVVQSVLIGQLIQRVVAPSNRVDPELTCQP